MTRTPPSSAHRAAPPAADQHRPPLAAAPPRQQAETRAAHDRFAARLDRDQLRESGKRPPDDSSTATGDRGRISAREQDQGRSDVAGGEPDSGSDAQPDLAFASSAASLQGLSGPGAAAAAAPATPLIDPALIERMAAQIAETLPSGTIEAVHIQFPEGDLVKGALLTRLADGSIAIRLSGLDPRVPAVQNARLQFDLTTALARRRLRIAALLLEDGAQAQRGEVEREAGAVAAIDRVV